MIGGSVPRLEDDRLLYGRGRFHEDVQLPGMLHLRVVRSPRPHGRLLDVDVSAARAMDGVRAVMTAEDLPSTMTIPVRQPTPGIDFTPYLQRPLATGWVRYVGEPVAVVVAVDPYVAEDAARAVRIKVDDRPVTLNARAAVGDTIESLSDAPALVGTVESSFGDVAAALQAAPHVVELDVETGRHTGMPLETRGLTAAWDSTRDRLTVWGATKVPFWNRTVIARFVGLADHQIHMRESDVGGSFGIRGELYPEDLLTTWLAHQLAAPVQWVEDRAEHLVSANHAREQTHVVRAGFDHDGTLLVLDDEAWMDTGAYIRTHGAVVAALTAGLFAGPYRVPAFRSRVHVVVTNKTGVGTYRAPGRFQSNFAREQLLDVAATRLGMSPEDIRLLNLLGATELPCERPMRIFGAPMALDGADHAGHYAQGLERVGVKQWRAQAQQARAEGRLVGVATAPILEKAGLGHENAVVSVDGSGTVRTAVGSTSVGQGAQTVMAQIAADALSVDYRSVSVALSDTDTLHDGGGTFASRTTVMGGTAVHHAAVQVAERARRVAAGLWQVDPAVVQLQHGKLCHPTDADTTLSLGAAATLAKTPRFVQDGEEPGLIGRSTFAAPTMTYPYGAHFAMVEVDPETFDVRVLKYAVTYEIGRVVHPAMARGQVEGGVAQGIGGALFEDLPYSADGMPLATSMSTYRMPTLHDVPEVEVHLFEDAPTNITPLGVRGIGEAGIAGVGAAVGGAVRDALQLSGSVHRLPLTPDHIRSLIEQGGSTSDLPLAPR